MRRVISFVIFFVSFNFSVISQNAGFNEISQGLYIYESNSDNFVVSDDLNDIVIEGWNVYGVDNIKVYINTYLEGSDEPFPESSWEEIVSVVPGENEAYIEIRCNSNCSPSNSATDPITFTYVKAFESNDILIYESDENVELTWSDYTPRNTIFYYKVKRNTSPILSGAIDINTWSTSNTFDDTSPKTPGTTYYYWVEASLNSAGWHKSGILEANYKSMTIPAELSVTPSSLDFSSTGETQSANITSNTSWSVTPSDSWIIVSQTSGTGNATINISVSASGESRSGTVTVSGGGITKIVNITQTVNPLTIESLMPADNSSGTALNSNLKITFNNAVNAVSGKYFKIYKSDGSLVSSIETTDSQISINNEVVTINPVNDFEGGVNYYVLIDAGAFVGNSSDSFNGISDPDTWNFTTILLPPTNLIATSISTTEIELSWDIVSDADSYSIYSCDETTTYATSITTGSYTISNLNSENSYDFIVKSVTDNAISSASNCASPTILCSHTWGEPVIHTTGTVATGIVTINGEPATADDQVGAFVKGELRAVENIVLDGGVSYISFNIQGDTIEIVSFKVWDNSECAELSLQFTTNTNPGGSIGIPPDYLPIYAGNTFSITINNIGNGKVELSPIGGYYNSGQVVSLTAIPDDGWQFEGWTSNNINGSNNPETITMDSDKSITVTFSSEATDTDNELLKQKIVLYPNPTESLIYIRTNDVRLKQLTIYDVVGKKISSYDGSSKSISLKKYVSGIYFIRIEIEDGSTIVKKIVKK